MDFVGVVGFKSKACEPAGLARSWLTPMRASITQLLDSTTATKKKQQLSPTNQKAYGKFGTIQPKQQLSSSSNQNRYGGVKSTNSRTNATKSSLDYPHLFN